MAVSAKPPERAQGKDGEKDFHTLSGEPVRELYTPEDLPEGIGGAQDPIGRPGARSGPARRRSPREGPRGCTARARARRTGCGSPSRRPFPVPARGALRSRPLRIDAIRLLSLIHISEPTRRTPISYAVFCLKKKKK